jgi:hypothetical protein
MLDGAVFTPASERLSLHIEPFFNSNVSPNTEKRRKAEQHGEKQNLYFSFFLRVSPRTPCLRVNKNHQTSKDFLSRLKDRR